MNGNGNQIESFGVRPIAPPGCFDPFSADHSTQIFPGLTPFVVHNGDAMNGTALGQVVIQRKVHRTAIVPDCDCVGSPLEAQLKLRSRDMLKQIIQ